MSTKIGTQFGQSHGDKYAAVLERWGAKLRDVETVTDSMKQEWASDLIDALEKPMVDALMRQPANSWKKVGDISTDNLRRLAQVSVRRSLAEDSFDLLNRLHKMAQEPETQETVTAAISVGNAVKRVGQTVSQMFDMAFDGFTRRVGGVFTRNGTLTGRRRWHTTSLKSRHRRLNESVKSTGESFTYNGNSIYGPRPPGGSPADWSNCSCRLSFERSDGSWVSI